MTLLAFHKVHGLGNDFLLVDGDDARQDFPAARVQRLCDRHFGVGADGILLVLPAERAHARMRILNADGSVAEMCGNGIRCFARHLAVHGGHHADELLIETDAGPKRCHLKRDEAGTVASVRVAMGAPRIFDQPRAHVVEGRRYGGRFVSMGNPHLVLFVDHTSRALAEQVGPALVAHPDYLEGTNVELVQVRGPREIEVVVFERGVGITLACGTGATASVAAACAEGLCERGAPVTVRLLGGEARVEIAVDDSESWLEGPAEESFRGTTGL